MLRMAGPSGAWSGCTTWRGVLSPTGTRALHCLYLTGDLAHPILLGCRDWGFSRWAN
jgi:hypothetical protein